MDFFYKPPSQRPDECAVLEENYVNCLMQKSLKDRVLKNRCVLDSILWFHLECPKAAGAFDDPNAFKLKFKDFFAQNKHDAALIFNESDESKRMQRQYDTNMGPDGVRLQTSVTDFVKENREIDPMRVVDDDGEADFYSSPWDEVLDIPDRQYFEMPKPTLSVDDSAKFGSATPYQ